jgi:hypothetical protein
MVTAMARVGPAGFCCLVWPNEVPQLDMLFLLAEVKDIAFDGQETLVRRRGLFEDLAVGRVPRKLVDGFRQGNVVCQYPVDLVRSRPGSENDSPAWLHLQGMFSVQANIKRVAMSTLAQRDADGELFLGRHAHSLVDLECHIRLVESHTWVTRSMGRAPGNRAPVFAASRSSNRRKGPGSPGFG